MVSKCHLSSTVPLLIAIAISAVVLIQTQLQTPVAVDASMGGSAALAPLTDGLIFPEVGAKDRLSWKAVNSFLVAFKQKYGVSSVDFSRLVQMLQQADEAGRETLAAPALVKATQSFLDSGSAKAEGLPVGQTASKLAPPALAAAKSTTLEEDGSDDYVFPKMKLDARGFYIPGSDGTYSQNYQDVWLVRLAKLNGWHLKPGFFMDLGAFDGLKCSNSALVEKKFGWKGICVEPRPKATAFDARNCTLVKRALSDVSMKPVRFYGPIGTQLQHINKQRIDRADDEGELIDTLNVPDMMKCMKPGGDLAALASEEKLCTNVPGPVEIPSFINFVSLDVEGQGIKVLSTFPFDQITVGVWIIEKEGDGKAERRILEPHGYVHTAVEHPGVDVYYVHKSVLTNKESLRKPWREHPEAYGSEC